MRKGIVIRGGMVCVLLLAAASWMTGCSDDDNNANPGGGNQSGSYAGTFVDGSGANGTLSFALPTTSSAAGAQSFLGNPGVSITGQLHVGGSTIDLTGTYDVNTGSLTLSGGGYTFSGVLQTDGSFTGSLTGPGGAGSWVALSGGTAATVYCGTYTCDLPACNPANQTESFNVVVSGSTAIAAVVLLNQTFGVAVGSVNGLSEVTFDVGALHVGGTVSATTIGGDWLDSDSGDGGTWSGSTAACTPTR